MSRPDENPKQESESRLYFLPAPPDSPTPIQISLELIKKLGSEMTEAFKSVPKRGLEIGGILLGTVDDSTGTIQINDYKRIDSEHVSGPSYVLSTSDHQLFNEVIAQFRKGRPGRGLPVGFFRSQTRPGLEFTEQDREMAREKFGGQPSVCLLVRPSIVGSGEALLGIESEGSLRPLLTFPFDADALREGDFAVIETIGPGVTGPDDEPSPSRDSSRTGQNQSAQLPSPGNLPAAHPRRIAPPRGAASIRTVAAFLSIAGLVAFAAWLIRRPATRTANAPSRSTAEAGSRVNEPISLNVERQNGNAVLSWNHASPSVRKADYALLTIEDGGKRQELRLNRSELETGRVVYVPRSRDLRFQMQLFAPAASVTESIRSFADVNNTASVATRRQLAFNNTPLKSGVLSRGEATVVTPPESTQPAASGGAPSVQAETSAEPPQAPAQPPAQPVPQPVVQPAPQQATAPARETIVAAPPAETEGRRQPAEPLPRPEPKTARTPVRPRPTTAVGVEAIGTSELKHVLRNLSPTHLVHPHSGADRIVHARPVREMLPDLSVIPELEGEKKIDVRVTISPSGNVVKTELPTGRTGDPTLTAAVLIAARQWVFEPAHSDGRPVQDKAILHFVMRPSETTASAGYSRKKSR